MPFHGNTISATLAQYSGMIKKHRHINALFMYMHMHKYTELNAPLECQQSLTDCPLMPLTISCQQYYPAGMGKSNSTNSSVKCFSKQCYVHVHQYKYGVT